MNLFNSHQRERFCNEDLLKSNRLIFVVHGMDAPSGPSPVETETEAPTTPEATEKAEAPKTFKDVVAPMKAKVEELKTTYKKDKVNDAERKALKGYESNIRLIEQKYKKKFDKLTEAEKGKMNEEVDQFMSHMKDSLVEGATPPDPDKMPWSKETKEMAKKMKEKMKSSGFKEQFKEFGEQLALLIQLVGAIKEAFSAKPPDMDTLQDVFDDLNKQPMGNPAKTMKQNESNYEKMLNGMAKSPKEPSIKDLLASYFEPRGAAAENIFSKQNAEGIVDGEQLEDIGRYMNVCKPAIKKYLINNSNLSGVNNIAQMPTGYTEIQGYVEGKPVTIEMQEDGTARIKKEVKEGEKPNEFVAIHNLQNLNELMAGQAITAPPETTQEQIAEGDLKLEDVMSKLTPKEQQAFGELIGIYMQGVLTATKKEGELQNIGEQTLQLGEKGKFEEAINIMLTKVRDVDPKGDHELKTVIAKSFKIMEGRLGEDVKSAYEKIKPLLKESDDKPEEEEPSGEPEAPATAVAEATEGRTDDTEGAAGNIKRREDEAGEPAEPAAADLKASGRTIKTGADVKPDDLPA